jgi:hypothetical protein
MLPDEYSHIPIGLADGLRLPRDRRSPMAPPGGKRRLAPSVVKRTDPVRPATFSRGEGGVR